MCENFKASFIENFTRACDSHVSNSCKVQSAPMAALTTIPVEGTVSCVSFSPHFLSSSLLAVGTESKIVIKSVSLTV